MRRAIVSLPQYVFVSWSLIKQEIRLPGVVLVKRRGKFTFTLHMCATCPVYLTLDSITLIVLGVAYRL